jgi:hypothetical protein
MKYTFHIVVLAVFIFAAASPVLAAGPVSGIVRTPDNSSLNGAVTVKLMRLGETVAEQWTGLDGRFRFENVEPGPYEISAKAFGFDQVTVSMDVFGIHPDVVIALRSPGVQAPNRFFASIKNAAKKLFKGLAFLG